ncbi:hypothetical protein Ciccas_006657 [Cichlidogyrus casuarinus]|uniref:Uncharacterized protein n=1 Tax=Cichlidogyrus casuarinus TaxID=1844966 RepID=A0ABD2Q542_9PLAT
MVKQTSIMYDSLFAFANAFVQHMCHGMGMHITLPQMPTELSVSMRLGIIQLRDLQSSPNVASQYILVKQLLCKWSHETRKLSLAEKIEGFQKRILRMISLDRGWDKFCGALVLICMCASHLHSHDQQQPGVILFLVIKCLEEGLQMYLREQTRREVSCVMQVFQQLEARGYTCYLGGRRKYIV